MDGIRNIIKWPISVVVTVVFAISAAVYFYTTQNLVKPANIQEAIQFLFEYPKEYMLALLFGGLAKVATVVMFILAIGVTINVITDFFYEYSRTFSVGYLIASWVAAIVIFIIQTNIVAYFWVLLGVIAVIMFFVYIWLESSKN